MEFSKLIKPTALFAALGAPVGAQAATTLNVDYSPTTAGTPITIGASATAQYTFQLNDTGIPFGVKTYLNANTGNFVGNPGSPAASTSVQTGGGVFPGGDGNYSLAFNIGNVAYTGFATVDRNGQHISSITYEAASGAVPEPATWAMMILGLGAVGFEMRRRRQTGAVAIA